MRTRHPNLGKGWSVSLWLWNGMPNNGRGVSGWFLSRGHDDGLAARSTHLGIGGTSGHMGRLIVQHGSDAESIIAGKTEIPRWQWMHVALVRQGDSLRVYLNGKQEIATSMKSGEFENLFFGGRSDNHSNWEGRLDEIVVIGRALTSKEVAQLSDTK